MDLDLPDAGDLDLLEDLCTIRPLATWRAWDRSPPRTSQRRALQGLQHAREVGIFGGNRSGKTELARAMIVALCNGSDHPDSVHFWRNNGADPRAFPKGPDTGWSIAISSGDSLRYHRRQILDLIPKWGPRHPDSEGEGRNWHARNLFGRGEAWLQWMVPGYDKPAEIWFKSEDQDIMTFQGDAIRVAWHDEEGLTEKRYVQVQYRLIDKDGYQILTDTPIHGRTWVYNRFLLRKDANSKPVSGDIGLHYIHTVDNPYLPAHRVAKVADDPVRGRGEFVVLEGRIWPEFGHLHQLPPFDLPRDAYRFRAIDFGTRHPFVCLHAALLRKSLKVGDRLLPDGALIVYRERYVAECTLEAHVDAIRASEGWRKVPNRVQTDDKKLSYTWLPISDASERIEITWADPEDAQQMLQLNHQYNLPTFPGIKDIRAGIQAVKARLTPGPDGEPSLYVFTTCTNTIREAEDYVWTKRMTAEGIEKDEPSDRSDHTCDALRYLTMGVDLGYGPG